MGLDISGNWTGVYRYDDKSMPSVLFFANILQSGSFISGTTKEDNSFVIAGPEILKANIEGEIAGQNIVFEKTYLAGINDGVAIKYTGIVDENSSRIEGVWVIDSFSGKFIMTRRKTNQASRIKRAIKENV